VILSSHKNEEVEAGRPYNVELNTEIKFSHKLLVLSLNITLEVGGFAVRKFTPECCVKKFMREKKLD
jgi:hypothetical protein